MITKIEHTSYTEKNGYTWRKRFAGTTMSIALLTRDHNTAVRRSTLLTMKFMEYTANFEFSASAMAETLKKYRDTMANADKMNQLRATLAATGYDLNNPTMPIPVAAQVSAVALHVAEEAVKANPKHGFEEAKQLWIDENVNDWREKTLNGFKNSANKLIGYLATNGVMYVEDVTRDHVRGFKQYLDECDFAPGSKKSYFNKNQSWFTYLVQDREWLDKNPFNGLAFKSSEVVNIKTPMTHDDFEHVYNVLQHDEEKPIKWMMAIMHHTGMRINEVAQLTPYDFCIKRGVKVISVNDNGHKTLKNKSSIRDIPINEKLLEMGLWEEKPNLSVMSIDKATAAVNGMFASLKMPYSSHCFRHGMQGRLRAANAQDSVIDFIMGHRQKSEGGRSYMGISARPLVPMLEALNQTAHIDINPDDFEGMSEEEE